MLVDRTSLTDLGLLPDASGAWPLAAWLDSTHVRPAHDALKRLIAEPLGDIESIRARQALLPQLLPVVRQIAWKELQPVATQVERFLSSNYEIIPAATIPRTLLAVRLRHVVSHVGQELRAVDSLLTLSEQVYQRIRAIAGDPAFTAVVTAFERVVQDERRDVLRAAVSCGNVLALTALDAMVRREHEPTGDDDSSLREPLLSLVAAIWQLDAFCSLAAASDRIGGILPRVVPRATAALSLEGLRHPSLPAGTASDVLLDDHERVLFLTGPNMAGKSTVLRAMGIAVYCAHLGMAVSATVACIPLHDQLLVSITVRDNLQRGESLYLAEIRRVRKIVDAVDHGDAVFAIFDEVFRGTNIKDATAATTLLVDGLAQASYGSFVIASHLAEVAELRTGSAGVACRCMEVDVTGSEPRFTYRMQRGVSDVHLGMVLLDSEGVGPVLRRMAAG
jgi:DNA mismatch repair protein MutS